MKAISGLPMTTKSIEIQFSNGKLSLKLTYSKTTKKSADPLYEPDPKVDDSENADSGISDTGSNHSDASDNDDSPNANSSPKLFKIGVNITHGLSATPHTLNNQRNLKKKNSGTLNHFKRIIREYKK